MTMLGRIEVHANDPIPGKWPDYENNVVEFFTHFDQILGVFPLIDTRKIAKIYENRDSLKWYFI
jgi:hypothetical protein